MLSLPQIEEILSRSRISKKSKELSVNIFFLINNLKPGVLWDFGKVDLPKLRGLECVVSDLVILVLDVDIFITSKPTILQSLSLTVADPPYFVNISRKLTEPVTASPDVIREQFDFISHVTRLISEAPSNVVTVELEDGWNLCSVFGLLLGFPVVYYSDTEEGNCLANIDLTVYRVETDNCSPISFSVPSRLESEASPHISRWERQLGRRCGCGVEARLRRETVNLPAVVV